MAQTQLDRIEAKIDMLLNLLDANKKASQVEDFRQVFQAGGVKALQSYVKNLPKRGQ